ncbi:proteasome subunit beta type-11-like [Callorhinchus milii]|uniref:proteasome subunit beta type-11-like n=1 Tax=Callorhinchus milii TaxID=7868 RepID=UPI001C3FB4D3|nr:proteasome subunit beta type-11-like [Callorhinchus milii]
MSLQDVVCEWRGLRAERRLSACLPGPPLFQFPFRESLRRTNPPSPAHGTTTLALTASECAVLAADTRSSCDSLIASPDSCKVVPVHTHLLATTSGTAADCASWLRWLAGECRLRQLRDGRLPGARAASGLLSAALSRHYRAHADLCLASLLCGWDRGRAEVWYVCHDGTRLNGEVLSVGSGSPYAYGVLDSGYRQGMPTSEALALARTAVSHAAHRDAYSGGCVDVYTVGQRGWEREGRRDVHCECEGDV